MRDHGNPMAYANDHSRTTLGFTVAIPAYKPQFLRAALDSLAAQTDSDFDTLVTDDAGPPEIAFICSEFASRLRLRYHRFPYNLGGTDLAAQWQRTVDLAVTPWAMVLGDDDQLDPGGVAAFRRAIAAAAPGDVGDLYRFDTRRVNAAGANLGDNLPHLAFATCNDLINARFCGRASYLNEFVFRIEALHRVGGFVSFPLGWSSDDATWILISQRAGVRRIDDVAKVSWRLSGINISSRNDNATSVRKLDLWLDFLQWIDRWDAGRPPAERLPKSVRIRAVDLFCSRWLDAQLPLQPVRMMRWAWHLAAFSRLSLPHVLRRLASTARMRLYAEKDAV